MVFILFVLVQEVLSVYTKCFIVSALQERGWLLLIHTLNDIICCGCMSVCVYVREREREGGERRGEREREKREEKGREEREERERAKKGWEGNG